MKKNKRLVVNKKEVERLFNSFKKNDLLEDRVEYSEEDFQLAHPRLNEKEAKMLYLKVQHWKYSNTSGKRKIAPSRNKIS